MMTSDHACEFPDRPLSGVRVLDLTRLLPGPAASLRLAEMGAEVIKIEEPGIGDYARTLGPGENGQSYFFELLNRGKSLLRLDLKQAADHAAFLALVAQADVVIESFRPGVLDKLQLSWDRLKQLRPSLVLCSITGYGQSGHYAHRAGHDINYLAYAGVLDQNTGPDGRPALCNLQIADLLGGALAAVQGILAALYAAKVHGRGRRVDVSMTHGAMALNFMPRVATQANTRPCPPASDLLTGGVPCYDVYLTADQRYMAVGALEMKFWALLCEVLHRPDLTASHWSQGQAIGGPDARRVRDELARIFKTKTQAHWTTLFESHDCCVTPVLRVDEALRHALFLPPQQASDTDMDTRLSSGVIFSD